jgi:cyclopropane fatty-acyl-phospholipid synthase-like methyltransferase
VSDPVDLAYLNGMYATGADPWRIEFSWYERRKRELVLGCLPRQRYRSGFEPGCAAGALTERLAERTDQLLAADLSEVAVRAAAERVAALPQVQVRRLLLPEQWPAGQDFDLIVLSEIGYFFTVAGWAELTRRVAAGLTPDATVLACHWRHDFGERTASTAALHAGLDAALGLPKQTSLADADFVIDVWTGQQRSVAERDGLLG